MISVDEALEQLRGLAKPLEVEIVPLRDAAGRVLAQSVASTRQQPPFAASAMDGYAVNRSDFTKSKTLRVIGESAAGARFEGKIVEGEAVRIFTGAPLPAGADWVVIQEDITAIGTQITIRETSETKPHIRPAGADFEIGQTLEAPQILTPQLVALLASMNISQVPVTRRPDVALISTGTELVMPGEVPGPDQIIASNTFGLKAMLEQLGAKVRLIPIAHDRLPALHTAFDLARRSDLIVTIGGASVGDHDLVADVARTLGMERAFYKVAMRPGKPLMAGKLGDSAMIGLPGNPVSAMVCGTVFVQPIVRAMLGLGFTSPAQLNGALARALPANGPRTHYMRARVENGQVTAFERQDSALLSVLAEANALLIRPPHEPAQQVGAPVKYIAL